MKGGIALRGKKVNKTSKRTKDSICYETHLQKTNGVHNFNDLVSSVYSMFAYSTWILMYNWAAENRKTGEEKSGFGEGHSTVCNIFIPSAAVQRYLSKDRVKYMFRRF